MSLYRLRHCKLCVVQRYRVETDVRDGMDGGWAWEAGRGSRRTSLSKETYQNRISRRMYKKIQTFFCIK